MEELVLRMASENFAKASKTADGVGVLFQTLGSLCNIRAANIMLSTATNRLPTDKELDNIKIAAEGAKVMADQLCTTISSLCDIVKNANM